MKAVNRQGEKWGNKQPCKLLVPHWQHPSAQPDSLGHGRVGGLGMGGGQGQDIHRAQPFTVGKSVRADRDSGQPEDKGLSYSRSATSPNHKCSGKRIVTKHPVYATVCPFVLSNLGVIVFVDGLSKPVRNPGRGRQREHGEVQSLMLSLHCLLWGNQHLVFEVLNPGHQDQCPASQFITAFQQGTILSFLLHPLFFQSTCTHQAPISCTCRTELGTGQACRNLLPVWPGVVHACNPSYFGG
jgi:hypothetical protein